MCPIRRAVAGTMRTIDRWQNRTMPRPPQPEMRPSGLPDDDHGWAGRIRRLERRAGVYRPGRSPIVWLVGPGFSALGTFAVTMWAGLWDGLGAPLTVGLGVIGGLVMGTMSWAFMGTSYEQEEDERRMAELFAARRAAAAAAPEGEADGGPDHPTPGG